MVMASRFRLRYHNRLFLLLTCALLCMMGCFVVFQHYREAQFKVELLNARLQMVNSDILSGIGHGTPIAQVVSGQAFPLEGLRISVFDYDGHMVYDSEGLSNPDGHVNINKPELKDAVEHGEGYAKSRINDESSTVYFYSAKAGNGLIVRSGVPDSSDKGDALKADMTYFWFMLAVALVILTGGFWATRHLGMTITRLDRFARRAERGERIGDVEKFPKNELGSIARYIVGLYSNLQKATIERDEQHRLALHEEKEKIRIKKQLTNNINHELKTPLASIQVCLETIMAHPDMTAEKRNDFIGRCYANSERLKLLLEDVSTLTRLDDGSRMIDTAITDLCQVIREAVYQKEPDIEKAGMTVVVDIPEHIMVCGNELLLGMLFANLITNAVRYSSGTRIDIRYAGECDGRYSFTFSDDGVGVPDDAVEYIFERFFRVDKGRSRRLGGTGLGLSIVRNAVRFHGGEITARNIKPHGLQFDITIGNAPEERD